MEKIPLREKLAYGLGDLASNLAFSSLNSFITFFYTNVIGIAAGSVGTIIFISKIFDGVVDVGYGILVDKTKTKYGKARP
jgi:GPH family glycoside/pentoside/hexuronide:cation symporter